MRSAFIAIAALAALLAPSAPAADVPRKAPEFSIYMPDGNLKLLSSFRGKVVVLEFLFTTCPHCQQTSVLMNQLQKEYGPKGFEAVGVAFNPMSKMLIPDYIRDFRVGFTLGYSERDPVIAFLGNDPNHGLHVPQLVIIDRKGMIRQQSLPRNDTTTATEANLRSMIEKLLKEPAGAPAKAPSKTKSKAS
jgi:peroxiredoxin